MPCTLGLSLQKVIAHRSALEFLICIAFDAVDMTRGVCPEEPLSRQRWSCQQGHLDVQQPSGKGPATRKPAAWWPPAAAPGWESALFWAWSLLSILPKVPGSAIEPINYGSAVKARSAMMGTFTAVKIHGIINAESML